MAVAKARRSQIQNAGFLSAVIAGGREQKRKGGPIQGSENRRPFLSSPAFPPATKAERDRFDLRHAWLFRLAADTDGDAGQGDADDGEPEPLTDDEVKNPRLKALSDEAAKRRNRAKAEKERADAAEAKVKALEEGQANTETLLGQVREGQMENAFLRVAFGKVADVDAAWKLADKTGVSITNEGVVEGLDAVLAKVLEKHPYLAPKPTDPDAQALADRFPALSPSGKPNNGPRGSKDSVDYEKLAKLFPALRGRR